MGKYPEERVVVWDGAAEVKKELRAGGFAKAGCGGAALARVLLLAQAVQILPDLVLPDLILKGVNLLLASQLLDLVALAQRVRLSLDPLDLLIGLQAPKLLILFLLIDLLLNGALPGRLRRRLRS